VGLIAVVVAPIAGCRRQPEAEPPSFRVRLLTTTPLSGRWEKAAERGLGWIAAELDAEVLRLRADDEAERRALIAEQGRAGVDLVFCVGPGFARALYTETGEFPDTWFVILPARARGANVASVEFLPDGVGYVAGVAAAHLSDRDAVGVIRGSGGQWLDGLEEGFAGGFLSVRRDGREVAVVPPEGPWELVAEGVAVALYAADRIEPRVLAEAHDAGLLLIGTDPALIELEPDVVVAAVEVDVAEAMVRVAREVHDGTFRGGPYTFDFGSGILDVVINPTMPATSSSDLSEALDEARSEVTAGIVEVERLVQF